jgi:hypothetical protein
MVDLLTVVTSVVASTVTGVVVAFLAPHFQHSVWKTQRLREQRIAVADRFAKPLFPQIPFLYRSRLSLLLAISNNRRYSR